MPRRRKDIKGNNAFSQHEQFGHTLEQETLEKIFLFFTSKIIQKEDVNGRRTTYGPLTTQCDGRPPIAIGQLLEFCTGFFVI